MSDATYDQSQQYNNIIRQTTWIVLALVLFTIPLHVAQTIPMLILVAVGALLNLFCYSTWLLQRQWFPEKAITLILQNLFVAAIIIMVGRTDLAYTGLLGIALVSATFWYGIRGMLIMFTMQALLLSTSWMVRPYPELSTSPVRAATLAGGILIILGILLARLTHMQRIDRQTLDALDDRLRIDEARLAALINTFEDAIAIVNSSGKITLANTAFLELTHITGNLSDHDLSEILHLQNKQSSKLNWTDALHSAPQHLTDYRIETSATTDKTVGDLSSPNPHDNNTTLDINISSISLEKQADSYIVRFKDTSAERSLNEQQSSFIAIASHELRTPLAFIEGSLSIALLPQTNLDPKTQEILKKAHDSTLFLSGLLQDLSTLYLAENDAIKVQLQMVDPRSLIEQAMADFTEQAKQKNLVLSSDIETRTPTVLTTQYHILQILRNLISNAIKYTESGSVHIHAEPAENHGVLFSVRDTGKGISQRDQQRLFTRFFQAENYETREQGGTGIGLYLSSELAKRINSRLWCESTLNEGSTFYLAVPPFSQLQRDRAEVVTAGVNNILTQI